MCFYVAIARPECPAIIAADHRHSLSLKTGESIREDYGGKLARFGNGWIALGGDALYSALAYERLQSVDVGDFAAVSQCLAQLGREAEAEIQNRWPGAPYNFTERTTFLLAADTSGECGGAVAAIEWNGKVVHAGYDACLALYPHRYPSAESTQAERQEVHDAFQASLAAEGHSARGTLQVIAREYASVSADSESVSNTIEIAVAEKYLTGTASMLAACDMLSMLVPAPQRDHSQNPFTRILTEHVAI